MSSMVTGQSEEYFIVRNVYIEGNTRTAQSVIENELNILPGDTVYTKNLNANLRENEKRLLSTGLFTIATINVKNWLISDQKADIIIKLQENWYIYPSLIFELADRNFNVWWTEHKRNFDRVNYGVSLDHINLTGHRDKLKLKFQRGYTHKYEANYKYPYLYKNWGLSGEIFYSTNKEIGYVTIDNKTVYQKAEDERKLLTRFRTGIGVNYRPTVYLYHSARLEYHHNTIDEIVAQEYNSDYFLDRDEDIQFFLFNYHIRYDKRVFTLYPEGGYSLSMNVKKEGLGVFGDFDNLSVDLALEKYFHINDNLIIGGRLKGKTNLIRKKIAFANNTGLGYGNDLVRGYELYVVDGTDWVLMKSSIKWKLYEKLQNLNRWMPLKQLKKMPFRLFLRFHIESGYVNEPTYAIGNSLNNRVLLGYGPALDFLLWNTALISAEYSFNHRGENSLFLVVTFNF